MTDLHSPVTHISVINKYASMKSQSGKKSSRGRAAFPEKIIAPGLQATPATDVDVCKFGPCKTTLSKSKASSINL